MSEHNSEHVEGDDASEVEGDGDAANLQEAQLDSVQGGGAAVSEPFVDLQDPDLDLIEKSADSDGEVREAGGEGQDSGTDDEP